MTIRNLYPEQLEELRETLSLMGQEDWPLLDDVEHYCGSTEDWTDEDCHNWYNGIVSDELLYKTFDGIDFGCDDFFCTAGQYDKYPDKEE